jgi:hypothetical protein
MKRYRFLAIQLGLYDPELRHDLIATFALVPRHRFESRTELVCVIVRWRKGQGRAS